MSPEDASTLPSAPDAAPTTPVESPAPLKFSWPATWVLILCLAAIAAALAQIAAGRSTSGLFLPSLTTVICLIAAWLDAATSRIPNPITYTAILLGLGLNLLGLFLQLAHADLAVRWLGAAGPMQSLYGFGLCAGIGLFALTLAGMGGGDAKLLAAMGALLGFQRVCSVLLLALAVAVVYSIVNLIILGRLNHVIRAAAIWFLDLIYLARPQKIVAAPRATIPLAVPMLIGLILSQTAVQRVMWKWLGT